MSVTVPRVLLLGADALLEEALGRTLPAATLIRAGTRAEYLAQLEEATFDVVLSDDNVPDCDGIEAFHLARRHDRAASFLFVTGDEPKPDRRALLALGASAVIGRDDLGQLGPAIQRALSGREIRADQARLLIGHEVLLGATRDLALAADLATVRSITQDAASRLFAADGTVFALRDGEQGHYADPEPAGEDPDAGTPFERGLGDWPQRHRQPMVVDDLATDPRIPPAGQAASVRSAVVVPVRSDQPIAALGRYWSQPHPPDVTEVLLLQALADSVAGALEVLRRHRQLQGLAASRTTELAALTYAVSHDLRAPIRHLEGFARILLQDVADLGPETRHAAQRIESAAAHLRDMVNGMLVLSRIAQAEVHWQSVDLAQLGREVAQALTNAPTSADGADRAGPVEFVAPEHLPVTGDPRLLLAVLQDLLGNAWKFTSRIPRPRVELGVQPTEPATGPGPVYFVRDNGAGFEPTSADRLFGVFQRLHSDEEFPGTGVGLAAVKRIVDKHGGTVRAIGAPDAGATIFFTLPD